MGYRRLTEGLTGNSSYRSARQAHNNLSAIAVSRYRPMRAIDRFEHQWWSSCNYCSSST